MAIKTILTTEEAQRIFREESFCIGGADALPVQTVAELLGEDASNFPNINGSEGNLYGLGENKPQVKYLYLKGFMKAVTYHNLMIYTKHTEEQN